jgi:hypothetical protein
MRLLRAAVALTATLSLLGAGVSTAQTASVRCSDWWFEGGSTCVYQVKQGEGWLAVARTIAPWLTDPESLAYAESLAIFNGSTIDTVLHPGRLVVNVPPDTPTTTTTTTPTTTTLPPTTTTIAPSTTTTTVPPTTSTTSTSTTSSTAPSTTTTTTITPTTTSTSTSTSTTTTVPSGSCSGAPNTPGGPDPWGGCWPGPNNTGPTGTLTNYTGSCDITAAGTVIENKMVNCPSGLYIYGNNVTIRNSQVNGEIHLSESSGGDGLLFENAFVNAAGCGDFCRAIDPQGHSWTMRRSEVVGGYSSGWCSGCLLENSWFHGIEGSHSSAMRFDQHSTAIHNVFSCDPPNLDACSADTTGYPDFQPTMDWLIQRNLYIAHVNGFFFCAYGGFSEGKEFSGHELTATNIRFIENVFQRGGGECGGAGPIADFAINRTGNVWSGNRWDDGVLIPVPEDI